MSRIGDRLVSWRMARGLSQHELAAIVGVTQATVARWETGVRSPRERYWADLERALRLREGTVAGAVGGVDTDNERIAALESEQAAIRLSVASMQAEIQRLSERIVSEWRPPGD